MRCRADWQDLGTPALAPRRNNGPLRFYATSFHPGPNRAHVESHDSLTETSLGSTGFPVHRAVRPPECPMTTRRYLDQKLRLHQMRAVDAVASHHTLLKASVALGISQPALSKTLLELEELLQLRVFERHSRGMRLTTAGAAFVHTSRRVLAELRRLDHELDQLSSAQGGVVTLGALPVAASGMLPGVLTRLRKLHPGITVRLQQGRTEELLPLLASGELDLIVGRLYQPAIPDSFQRQPLWTEPISVLARIGHPIFAEPRVTAEDIRRCDLVLPTVTQRVGQEIEHLLAQLGITPGTALRSSSYEFIREMLLSTDLISLMPRLMMVGDLLRGVLRVAPLPVAAPPRPAGLLLDPARPLNAAPLAFVACLSAYVAEIAQRGITPITDGYSDDAQSDTTPPVAPG